MNRRFKPVRINNYNNEDPVGDGLSDVLKSMFNSAAKKITSESTKKVLETAAKSAVEPIAKKAGEKVANKIFEEKKELINNHIKPNSGVIIEKEIQKYIKTMMNMRKKMILKIILTNYYNIYYIRWV